MKFYKTLLYDWKLRNKLLVSHILVMIIPIFMMVIVVTYIIGDYILKSEQKNHLKNIETINQTMDYNFNQYRSKGDIIFSSMKLQDALGKEYTDMNEVIQGHLFINDFIQSAMSDFNNYLSKYFKVNQDIENVIYSDNSTLRYDGHIIKSTEDIKDQPWYNDVANQGSYKWVLDDYDKTSGNQYMILRRRLIDVNKGTFLGILQIKVPIHTIEALLTINYKPNPKEALVYVNENKKIIAQHGDYNNNEIQDMVNQHLDFAQPIISFKWNGQDYLLSHVKSQETGNILVSIVYLHYVKEGYKNLSKATIFIIILSVGLCIMVSILVAYALSSRLTKLMYKVKAVQKDYYESLVEFEGNDEIGQLNQVFNKMIKEIRQLIFIEYKSRIVRERTKLELLQEQINPHLLYNTLSLISWQSKEAGQEETYHITKSLIRFYRTTLNRGEIIVQLNQETQMACEYIEILEYTYELSFEKEIQFEKEIEKYYGIKLILQPLIENAIMHGLRNSKNEKKKLKVSGKMLGDSIQFIVEDNGGGMEQAMIEQLLYSEQEKGYGLSNVIKRIRLYYGEQQAITVDSEINKGTKVTISIPAMKKKQLKQHLRNNYLI